MKKIGLEIHGYLDTNEKLFCRCKNLSSNADVTVNTLICPICTGQPGSKPLLPNAESMKKCIQIALMLNSKVNLSDKNKDLIWQRKHYSWPDLPKGYQNTLSGPYAIPVAENGKFQGIRIRELHLEEDPAAWDPITGCIDYNRSGSPLIEIVTEPDFTSSAQVRDWLKKLLITLSYIKSIKKGSGIKADVNVNIEGVSERTEVKNVNSISEIVNVIEYEFNRHKKERPKKLETRRWDAKTKKTQSMRSKESTADYRFVSDPDLPVIKITNKEVKAIEKNLPDSPEVKLQTLIKKHKINKKNAEILSKNLDIVEFFESSIKTLKPAFVLPWVTVELLRVLNYNKKNLDEVDIEVSHFVELLKNIQNRNITELKAKQILNKFVPKSFSIKNEIKSSSRITNEKELTLLITKILKNNQKAVDDFLKGNENSFNFLMGQVMNLSKRRADYKIARNILKKLLKN